MKKIFKTFEAEMRQLTTPEKDCWISLVKPTEKELAEVAELYAIDGNAAYLGDVQRTLDYAWEHARDAQGLFETDFTGADKQSEKWLLTQGAMAEMYGRMSGVKLDQTK